MAASAFAEGPAASTCATGAASGVAAGDASIEPMPAASIVVMPAASIVVMPAASIVVAGPASTVPEPPTQVPTAAPVIAHVVPAGLPVHSVSSPQARHSWLNDSQTGTGFAQSAFVRHEPH